MTRAAVSQARAGESRPATHSNTAAAVTSLTQLTHTPDKATEPRRHQTHKQNLGLEELGELELPAAETASRPEPLAERAGRRNTRKR